MFPTFSLEQETLSGLTLQNFMVQQNEDAQEFINEIYKVLAIIEVSLVEKPELDTYQLKGVTQVWFTK